MKVQLTKAQIVELYEIMGKNRKENTELYNEIKDILHLYARVGPGKLIDIHIDESEIDMVREMLNTQDGE